MKNEKGKIESKSYTIYYESGQWLGQIVLTSDGMFAAVTDYGNLSYAWRSFGNDFEEFICDLNIGYFASKMQTGMSYIAFTRKTQKACDLFAEKILPPLQKLIKEGAL